MHGHDARKGYRVGQGKAIMIPARASNAWHSETTVKKLFCIPA